ncbi:MAG: type II toxin-antitoxin system mRNA interferase toxin, RelE/StbE family [Sphaerobacteraceae bacterium]|nr:MAG: type II toxin-antitoxin system mRNA interferase toxin, RelE/StbE family [Sphaerobacteraceae bacterium]
MSPRFERQLKRFYRRNPQLRQRVRETFRSLELDPFQPRLRLHALRGNFEGFHAVRIDYSNRIILTLRIETKSIRLIDIGSHDEVYR